MTPEERNVFGSMSIIVEALIGIVHPDALKAEVEKVHAKRAAAEATRKVEAEALEKARAQVATEAAAAQAAQHAIPAAVPEVTPIKGSRKADRQVAPNGVVLPVKGNEFSGKDYQKAVLALQAPLPPAKPRRAHTARNRQG